MNKYKFLHYQLMENPFSSQSTTNQNVWNRLQNEHSWSTDGNQDFESTRIITDDPDHSLYLMNSGVLFPRATTATAGLTLLDCTSHLVIVICLIAPHCFYVPAMQSGEVSGCSTEFKSLMSLPTPGALQLKRHLARSSQSGDPQTLFIRHKLTFIQSFYWNFGWTINPLLPEF